MNGDGGSGLDPETNAPSQWALWTSVSTLFMYFSVCPVCLHFSRLKHGVPTQLWPGSERGAVKGTHTLAGSREENTHTLWGPQREHTHSGDEGDDQCEEFPVAA